MSKPLLGIAELLPATAKIYYESIFSEHQIGRAVDLICAIVAEEKIDTQALRCALTAAITEGCRNQSMLAHAEESRRRTTPVSVEVGIDGRSISAAIGFYLGETEAKTDSPLTLGTELQKNLENIQCFADVSSLNVEKSSGFAEIIFSLPAQQDEKSRPLRCIFIQNEGPTPKAAEREYIELGDVEFTRILDPHHDTAQQTETLLHSLSDAKKANLLAEADPSGAVSLLRKSLKPEDIDKLIAESLQPQEKAKILTASMTPDEVGKILKENLSAEDQAKILAEADPENTVTVIKDIVNRTQIETIVIRGEREPSSDDFTQIISGSAPPAATADSGGRSEFSLLEEARALAQDEPEIVVAALKKSLSPEEMGKLVVAHMKPDELREAICAGLSKTELAKLMAGTLPADEEKLALPFTPEQFELTTEQVRVLMDPAASTQQVVDVLSKVMPKKVAQSFFNGTIPKAEVSSALEGFLPNAALAPEVATILLSKSDTATKRPPRASSEEVEQEFELEAQKLEQNLQGVIQTIEQLKDEFPDKKSKKQVESLLTQVLLEKAKINELSLELSTVFRKKEHMFRHREAALVEELRQSKQLVNQRNSNIERMKELMSRMQLKMRTESESSGENAVNETQMRVKYEHSQRQIDSLKEEIERLNRRAQNSMNSQQSAAQQRELAKLQKEAAAAVKALATKKQEIDLIKRQLNERDAREAEYKRTVLRLQNEVAAVKATAHSAAKKPAA